MKYKRELILSAACFLMSLLCFGGWIRIQAENPAGRIAPKILRLHVLAGTNSPKDQKLKLEVKSFLIETLAACLPEASAGKEGICDYVNRNKAQLEEEIEAFAAGKGSPCSARVCVTSAYFPAKAYGGLVFPCGTYDAVQVTLGEGRGRNWWCVLYPRLCFSDAVHAVLPEESREELRKLLGEEDYNALIEQKIALWPFSPSKNKGSLQETPLKLTVRSGLAQWLSGPARSGSKIPQPR